eukprot:726803-Rhodomonas_salina.6
MYAERVQWVNANRKVIFTLALNLLGLGSTVSWFGVRFGAFSGAQDGAIIESIEKRMKAKLGDKYQ